MNKIVEVKNITKRIKGKLIIDNINFSCKKGEIIGLVGNNGAGKSTLLKIMCGLYKPDEGDVLYDGISLSKDFENAIKIVGTLIETPDMYRNLSGNKNLELFKNMFKGIDENRIKEIISIMELEKVINNKFKTYSLGMKERLGIANALVNNPKVLILDEPTNGLDPKGIISLRKLLLDLKDTTIIISSHILSEIENLCDRVLIIKEGKIIKEINTSKNSNKKKILFEVDDYSRAKLILNNYCINEELEVYESDETISALNKELILNNINVYRIIECNDLEKELND